MSHCENAEEAPLPPSLSTNLRQPSIPQAQPATRAMQRVRPKQEVEQNVSLSTSVSTVKTLLSTGVGCISYLRFVAILTVLPPSSSIAHTYALAEVSSQKITS